MKPLWPLSTLTLPYVQRQNQEVGFWWLSWLKAVHLGDVLSLWMNTGMAREEFTGSFYPLSSVVSLACTCCWTLCELLALTKVDLIPDPVPSELRGAMWARQGERYSSEFSFQGSVELCALETEKRCVCGMKWKAAAVHCLQGGNHKREHCRPLEQGLDFSVTCQVLLLLRALS